MSTEKAAFNTLATLKWNGSKQYILLIFYFNILYLKLLVIGWLLSGRQKKRNTRICIKG